MYAGPMKKNEAPMIKINNQGNIKALKPPNINDTSAVPFESFMFAK